MAANKTRKQNAWIWVCFLAYLFALFYMLFFAEAFGRTGADHNYSYNLKLFQEIKRYYLYGIRYNWDLFLLNVVGNVVVFIPLGIFVPRLIPRCRNFLLAILMGLEFSFLIETIQLVSKVGTFDVDDLFLNTLGAAFGYLIYVISTVVFRARHDRPEKEPERRFDI